MAWGPMSVERHRALCQAGTHLRVYRFNVDVSHLCRWFDDTPGQERAELYRLNESGCKYVDQATGEPAIEVVTSFDVREGEPFHSDQGRAV